MSEITRTDKTMPHRLRENKEAYNRFKIRPRVLVPVQAIDSSTTIFGQKVNFTPVWTSVSKSELGIGSFPIWLRPQW